MCCFNKFILFTTNAIIFVFGIVVITIASITISRASGYNELLREGTVALPIIILCFGIFITLFGFMGCLGALWENKCMLYTYAIIVLILFLGEIVVAILLIAHPEITRDYLEETLNKQFNNYGNGDEALEKAIDSMQQSLECCGVDNFKDWNAYESWTEKNPKFVAPWSCCEGYSESDGTCSFGRTGKIYKTGCLDAIIDEYQNLTLALGITGIILAIFLFFSMTTACGLARKRKHDNH